MAAPLVQPAAADPTELGVVIRDPWYEFSTDSRYPGQPNYEALDRMGRELAAAGARWVRLEFIVQQSAGTFDEQIAKKSIITGTPETVIPKVREVLEYIRPGSVFFWDGDGAMTHEDSMRSLRLMGEEVIPAMREISKELDLKSPFERDPVTGKDLTQAPGTM